MLRRIGPVAQEGWVQWLRKDESSAQKDQSSASGRISPVLRKDQSSASGRMSPVLRKDQSSGSGGMGPMAQEG